MLEQYVVIRDGDTNTHTHTHSALYIMQLCSIGLKNGNECRVRCLACHHPITTPSLSSSPSHRYLHRHSPTHSRHPSPSPSPHTILMSYYRRSIFGRHCGLETGVSASLESALREGRRAPRTHCSYSKTLCTVSVHCQAWFRGFHYCISQHIDHRHSSPVL